MRIPLIRRKTYEPLLKKWEVPVGVLGVTGEKKRWSSAKRFDQNAGPFEDG
jgi:hypothetical protein